jgi:hypothetical protein
MALAPLRFLLGNWRGEGAVRDGAVTATVVATERDDGAIVLVHETRGADLPLHRERMVLREKRGRTTALVRADGGAEQEFRLAESGAVLRFVHRTPRAEEIVWEIEPRGADAWTERFLVPEDGKLEKVVELRHERAPA